MVYLITCNKCKLYVGETSQNLYKLFNWHNSSFRKPTAHPFCKIWNTHFSEIGKESPYTVNINEKLEGAGVTGKNAMHFVAKTIQKAGEILDA